MTKSALKWCLFIAGFTIYKAEGNISLPERSLPYILPTSSVTTVSILATKTNTVSILAVSNLNKSAAEPTVLQPANQTAPDLAQDPTRPPSPPLSQHSDTSDLSEHINVATGDTSKESNDLNDIFTGEDEHLNLREESEAPSLENAFQDAPVYPLLLEHTESHHTWLDGRENDIFPHDNEITGSHSEDQRLGLESWKIGIISAAVFLVLEAAVLAIYCLVCRKRKQRTVIVNKNCEQDSDAAETINAESSENTFSGEDGTLNLVSLREALEFPETKDEDPRIDCLLVSHPPYPQSKDVAIEF